MLYSECYKVLGIKPDATPQEIKAAYRRLVKKYHPDVNPDKKEAQEQMKKINEAYNILKEEFKARAAQAKNAAKASASQKQTGSTGAAGDTKDEQGDTNKKIKSTRSIRRKREYINPRKYVKGKAYKIPPKKSFVMGDKPYFDPLYRSGKSPRYLFPHSYDVDMELVTDKDVNIPKVKKPLYKRINLRKIWRYLVDLIKDCFKLLFILILLISLIASFVYIIGYK